MVGAFVERVAFVAMKTTMTAVDRRLHQKGRARLSAHMVEADAAECRVECPGIDRELAVHSRH